MSMIKKFEKYGLKKSVNIGIFKLREIFGKLVFLICKLLPLQSNLIVFESEGDLSDNSFALFNYMLEHGYLHKYKIVWLVDDLEQAQKNNFPNTVYSKKSVTDKKTAYYLSRCKWYIFDHNNLFIDLNKKLDQKIIFLNHGAAPFKKTPSKLKHPATKYDYLIVTGNFPKQSYSKYPQFFGMWGAKKDQMKILGFPRNDYFFSDLNKIKCLLNCNYHFNTFKKVILWMPTFRQSNNKSLSENYLKNETGLPLIDNYKDFVELNNYLLRKNILLVLKIHHLQENLSIFSKKFSNILFLRDNDLRKLKIQLYQFIPLFNALVTDYSSVSADYLLLDKPIVYIVNDIKEYRQSRGLFPKNILDYFAGDHVYNLKEFYESLDRISDNIDKHKSDRERILPIFQKFKDGNSSKRILKFLNILK